MIMVMQILTDAADSQHGAMALLCLAALARGAAGSQTSLHAAARTASITQAKLTQMIKQLAPNLQAGDAYMTSYADVCIWIALCASSG